nr:protein aig2 c [Quercus suber]
MSSEISRPFTSSSASRTAFFYGTLMAPQVLHRVCHGGMDTSNPIYMTHNLRIQPAILPKFRRHRVKGADYPAIMPHQDAIVRGTLVTGLTDADIWRLDIFEGDEYQRKLVLVGTLIEDGVNKRESKLQNANVEAETYVWVAGEHRLEEREWDLEEFKKEKMMRWVGVEGEGEYAELDEAVANRQDGTGGRGINGAISERLKEERIKKADNVLESAAHWITARVLVKALSRCLRHHNTKKEVFSSSPFENDSVILAGSACNATLLLAVVQPSKRRFEWADVAVDGR